MAARIGSLLLLAVVIPACRTSFLPSPIFVVNGILRGSQVVPAVATPVTTSNATLMVATNKQTIDFLVTYTGSGTITAVEIRLGVAGTNGGLLFTLATGPFTNPLSGTLGKFDLVLSTEHDVMGIEEACNRILAGKTYLLVRTAADPDGEMRGQLGSAEVASAVLSGAQEVPPVAGAGTGTFTVEFNDAQDAFTATLAFSGLGSSADAAHIHFGAAGVGSGPIIFDLSLVTFTSPLVVTLTSADFLTDPSVVTFADAIDALLTGQMYVNVHTSGNPTGEIRGQIGPARLSAALTGGDVFPPNGSAATGAAEIILNATQTDFRVMLTHDVVSASSVLIHAEDPGVNGPQIFDVDAIAGSAASPVDATLNETHLIPSAPKGINTFNDVVNALLTGKLYLDIASPGFPAGEIRGQIVP